MRVDVYFNLHRKVWSVRDRATGRVVAHERYVYLSDCEFVVSEAGRQRVLREQRKNVHAYVRGTWVPEVTWSDADGEFEVSYNPYKAPTFVLKGTDVPVTKAPSVVLDCGVRPKVFARFDRV